MADQLLDQVRDAVEGQIVRRPGSRPLPCRALANLLRSPMQDFEGQRLAELLTTVLLGAAGVRLTFPLP